MIAEPWDVGDGGWQVGGFPSGWSEWNDGYRDRMRNFWLRDIARGRDHGIPSEGIGSLARRLAGSNHVFTLERGPLASVNFITAHDGFTAADLVAYDDKHNEGNGEHNRDGSNDNKSYNHGVEGETQDAAVLQVRRRAIRNLLGTLLLSAGIPMLTAGDEFGRTQRGNNNAYCIDSELTWVSWDRDDWQLELFAVVRQLIRLRRENPALRPVRYGRFGEHIPSAVADGLVQQAGPVDVARRLGLPRRAHAAVPRGVDAGVRGVQPDPARRARAGDVRHRHVARARGGGGLHAAVGFLARRRSRRREAEHVPGEELVLGPTSMRLFRAH